MKSTNRPIRTRIVKSLSFTRVPYGEPLTPGLRRQQLSNPVGFMSDLLSNETRYDQLTEERKPVDGKE